MFADANLWFGVWALSGFWLWAFTIVISGIMIGTVLAEEAPPAVMFLGVLIVFAHLVGAVDVVALLANPLLLLLYLMPYLIIGLAFCIIKYRFWLRKKIAEDMGYYTAFDGMALDKIAGQYTPSKIIGRLTIWIIWWPICLLRLMLGDWIQAVVRYIVTDILGKFFQTIWKGELDRIKNQQKGL